MYKEEKDYMNGMEPSVSKLFISFCK